jgi:hypothetical protein
MLRKHQLLFLVLLLPLAVTFGGSTRFKSQNAASPSATPATLPSPKLIKAADLAKLRWIEGSWRGTGGGVPTFYERYRFESDSTLVVESFDETFTKVSEVSRFELKDGHFGSGAGDSESVATALDDISISFAPTGKGNFFRFQRESADTWKAILNWTNKDGVAKERVYVMERTPGTANKKP